MRMQFKIPSQILLQNHSQRTAPSCLTSAMSCGLTFINDFCGGRMLSWYTEDNTRAELHEPFKPTKTFWSVLSASGTLQKCATFNTPNLDCNVVPKGPDTFILYLEEDRLTAAALRCSLFIPIYALKPLLAHSLAAINCSSTFSMAHPLLHFKSLDQGQRRSILSARAWLHLKNKAEERYLCTCLAKPCYKFFANQTTTTTHVMHFPVLTKMMIWPSLATLMIRPRIQIPSPPWHSFQAMALDDKPSHDLMITWHI